MIFADESPVSLYDFAGDRCSNETTRLFGISSALKNDRRTADDPAMDTFERDEIGTAAGLARRQTGLSWPHVFRPKKRKGLSRFLSALQAMLFTIPYEVPGFQLDAIVAQPSGAVPI